MPSPLPPSPGPLPPLVPGTSDLDMVWGPLILGTPPTDRRRGMPIRDRKILLFICHEGTVISFVKEDIVGTHLPQAA